MTLEEECLVLLAQTEDELLDTLEIELEDLKAEDEELYKVEDRLEEIRVKMLEYDEQENPNMEEVEALYREYLALSNRQSQLTDCLQIGIETVGICESALY